MLASGGKFNSGPGLSAPAGTNSGSELELRSFTTQHAPPAGFRAAGAGRGGSDTQATPWAFSLSFPSWSRSRPWSASSGASLAFFPLQPTAFPLI